MFLICTAAISFSNESNEQIKGRRKIITKNNNNDICNELHFDILIAYLLIVYLWLVTMPMLACILSVSATLFVFCYSLVCRCVPILYVCMSLTNGISVKPCWCRLLLCMVLTLIVVKNKTRSMTQKIAYYLDDILGSFDLLSTNGDQSDYRFTLMICHLVYATLFSVELIVVVRNREGLCSRCARKMSVEKKKQKKNKI